MVKNKNNNKKLAFDPSCEEILIWSPVPLYNSVQEITIFFALILTAHNFSLSLSN